MLGLCLPGAQRLIIAAATGGGGTALVLLLIADSFGGNNERPHDARSNHRRRNRRGELRKLFRQCMISLLDLALEDLFGRPGLITPVIGALSILGTMAGVMYAYHLWRVTR